MVVRAVLPSVCASFFFTVFLIISGRSAVLRARGTARGFFCSAFPVCFFARSRAPKPQRAGAPCPHFVHHSASLICLRGGWGCRLSFGRCSAVALHRSRTVCCVPAACGAGSATRRNRTQMKLLLCVRSPVRSALVHSCLGGHCHRMLARAAAAVASRALLRPAFAHIAACSDTAACAAYWALC